MANFKTPYTFVAGTKAKAEEVNENFSAIKDELNKKQDLTNDGYITIKDAISDNQPVSKSQLDTTKTEINNIIKEKIENKELKRGFVINSCNIDSEGNADLLDIEDNTKIVFKIDNGSNYKPLKCTYADGTPFERTSVPDLNIANLSDGIYNLFIDEEGECTPIANNVFRDKSTPKSLTENLWTQPVLANGNAQLGGNTFAVKNLGADQGYAAWRLFDNDSLGTVTDFGTISMQGLVIYNPIPIKIGKIEFQNEYTAGYRLSGASIYGSNDDLSYDLIKTFTTNTTPNVVFDLSDNTKSFRYYKIVPTTSGYYPLYKSCVITASKVTGNNLLNAVWLDTSTQPYSSKKYNGTAWENFNYVQLPQKITVKNGAITNIDKCCNLNDDGWENYVLLPDYSKSSILTKDITFEAPLNGWIYCKGRILRPLFKGETFTANEDSYIFYAMKGD